MIQLADYPYTSARVSAKRAKLLDEGDYDNLLKMQPNEIARNLEEGDYRKEINELGSDYQGVELVELALNQNLSRTLSHLCEIAPGKLEQVINAYLRRYDLTSLKRILRWKKSGQEVEIQDLMVSAGSLDRETLEEIAEMEFDQIVEMITFEDARVDYQEYLEGKEELRDIERALDQAYFDELKMLESRINSPQFQRFIKKEMEHENLRTVLRLKKYGFSRDEIEQYLFSSPGKIAEKVIQAEDISEALDIVREEEEVEGRTLEEVEHALEAKRLGKALTMARAEPLGVTSILGYLVAKIAEVKNLRMLIRAKEAEVQNTETIRRNLVTA